MSQQGDIGTIEPVGTLVAAPGAWVRKRASSDRTMFADLRSGMKSGSDLGRIDFEATSWASPKREGWT